MEDIRKQVVICGNLYNINNMDYKEKLITLLNNKELSREQKEKLESIFPELKESEDEKIKREIVKFLKENKDFPEDWIAWLEKQSEQKSADKVEPKFHEGEWLCENEQNNYARFIQILEIVNVQGKKRYRISRDIHNDEDIVEFDFVEKYYHKFGIQDAKAGDVLCYEDEIFMLKNYVLFHKIVYHCCYDNKNFIPHSIYSLTKDDFNNVHPATKEQCDLLFRKMKEVGYEWDADKKELKKIEQNITLSDENENIFEEACKIINSYGNIITEQNEANKAYKIADKLKSLKPQPKQEWSEYDEKMLNELITIMEGGKVVSGTLLSEYAYWLKSLKPQSHWKPTKEQLSVLYWVITNIQLEEEDEETLQALYKLLKKL